MQLKHNILVEAWSPLANGKVFDSETVKAIAQKYNRSISQVCLRWVLQKGNLPLCKSTNPTRIQENMNIFDFNISPEDMKALDLASDVQDSGMYPDSIWFQ